MRKSHKSYSRAERVNEQIRRELAQIIRFGLKDPHTERLLKRVTVNAVEVTPDYAHARVFYTALASDNEREAVAQALDTASGLLRRELGRRVRIHHLPELHFYYDESIERGARLTQLIDAAIQSSVS